MTDGLQHIQHGQRIIVEHRIIKPAILERRQRLHQERRAIKPQRQQRTARKTVLMRGHIHRHHPHAGGERDLRHQTGQSYGIGRRAGRTSGTGVVPASLPHAGSGEGVCRGHGEPHRHHPGVKIRVEPVFQAERQLQPFAGVNESCGYVPDAAASALRAPNGAVRVVGALALRHRHCIARNLAQRPLGGLRAEPLVERVEHAGAAIGRARRPLHEPQAVQRRLNSEQRCPLLRGHVVVEPQPEQRCGAQTDQCHVVFRGDGTNVGRPRLHQLAGGEALEPARLPLLGGAAPDQRVECIGQRTVQQAEDDLPDAAAARAGRNALRLRDMDEGEPADRQEVPQLPVAGEEESPRITRGVDETVSLVPCRLVFAHDHRLTAAVRVRDADGTLPLPVLPLGEFQRRAQAGKTGQRSIARIDLAVSGQPREQPCAAAGQQLGHIAEAVLGIAADVPHHAIGHAFGPAGDGGQLARLGE